MRILSNENCEEDERHRQCEEERSSASMRIVVGLVNITVVLSLVSSNSVPSTVMISIARHRVLDPRVVAHSSHCNQLNRELSYLYQADRP